MTYRNDQKFGCPNPYKNNLEKNILGIKKCNKNLIKKKENIRKESSNILIGTTMINDKKRNYYLTPSDINNHILICGATGSGKSNFLKYFLLNFLEKYEIPFLLLAYKSEYNFLEEIYDDIIILRPGENFSINIFDTSISPNKDTHVNKIVEMFKSGGIFENVEYSPQMEGVLKEVLMKICGKKESRNWESFYKILKEYKKGDKKMTAEAIESRINQLAGNIRNILGKTQGINLNEIFSYKVIIDLNKVHKTVGGMKNDLLFFVNALLLFIFLRTVPKTPKMESKIKYLIIIEDAARFVDQKITNKSISTTYIEDVAMFQRALGNGLILLTTSLNISENIINNSNTIGFTKINDNHEYANRLLNLRLDNKYALSQLNEGTLVIKSNTLKKPFLVRVPKVDKELIRQYQIRNNRIKNFSKKNQKKCKQLFKLDQSSLLNKAQLIFNDSLFKIRNNIFCIFEFEDSLNNLIKIIITLNKLLKMGYFNYYSIQIEGTHKEKALIIINFLSDHIERWNLFEKIIYNELYEINIKLLKQNKLKKSFLSLANEFNCGAQELVDNKELSLKLYVYKNYSYLAKRVLLNDSPNISKNEKIQRKFFYILNFLKHSNNKITNGTILIKNYDDKYFFLKNKNCLKNIYLDYSTIKCLIFRYHEKAPRLPIGHNSFLNFLKSLYLFY